MSLHQCCCVPNYSTYTALCAASRQDPHSMQYAKVGAACMYVSHGAEMMVELCSLSNAIR